MDEVCSISLTLSETSFEAYNSGRNLINPDLYEDITLLKITSLKIIPLLILETSTLLTTLQLGRIK